jgi:urea transport system ATP-binding protein
MKRRIRHLGHSACAAAAGPYGFRSAECGQRHQIAELGIGRKFQTPSVFSSLTVAENLEIAMSQNRSVLAALRAKMRPIDRERIGAQLAMIGLADKAGLWADGLSHGEKQWLEIGMMLLLEPVAGMTDRETDKTGGTIAPYRPGAVDRRGRARHGFCAEFCE